MQGKKPVSTLIAVVKREVGEFVRYKKSNGCGKFDAQGTRATIAIHSLEMKWVLSKKRRFLICFNEALRLNFY